VGADRVGRGGTGAAPRCAPPIEREDRARLVAVSLLWVAIPFTLFPLAQQHVASAVAGMLNGTTPIVTALVATLLLRRLPGRLQIAGLLLGFLGVALIAIPAGSEGSSEAIGVVMLVVAASCYGWRSTSSCPSSSATAAAGDDPGARACRGLTAPFGVASIPASTFAWSSLAAVLTLGAIAPDWHSC